MQGKKLYDFLFDLYDFADYMGDRIEPDDFFSSKYFITMVLIEEFFDLIGRGEIKKAAEVARDNGHDIDPSEALSEAHRRIDALRERILKFSQQYDFDQSLEYIGRTIAEDWKKSR